MFGIFLYVRDLDLCSGFLKRSWNKGLCWREAFVDTSLPLPALLHDSGEEEEGKR